VALVGVQLALGHVAVRLGERPRPAGEDLVRDGQCRGVIPGDDRREPVAPDVPGAYPLAELQLPVGAEVGAAGRGEVLEGAGDEGLGRPCGSRGRELHGRPSPVHHLADVPEAEVGDVETGGRADLEHGHRQLELLRRRHGVAQMRLVGVLDEVGVGRQGEVADAQLFERPQPDARVLDRGGPEAVGDEAPLEPFPARVGSGLEDDRVGQRRLAALEVDHLDLPGGRRLVHRVAELRERHRLLDVG